MITYKSFVKVDFILETLERQEDGRGKSNNFYQLDLMAVKRNKL
jgi:hypothetical protein